MPALRQPSGTGFALRDALPWHDLAAIVRASEAAGYDALFLPEIAGRDALATLAAMAGETRDLRLGTGVVPMRARTLLLTAMAAATVQERSSGRLILGLGTGDAGRGALDELRETVLALRALLAGEEIDRPGWPGTLSLDPGWPVPIWISALGPRGMRLAGEVADGVLLNWCPPERVAVAVDRIEEGAEAAGRDPGEVALGVYVRAWTGEDDAEGLRVVRTAVAQYASYRSYARQLREAGLGAEADAASAALRAGRLDDVPDRLVSALCAFGDDAPAHLEAYRRAGATLPIVYPVAGDAPAESIEATLLGLAPDPLAAGGPGV